MITLNAWFNKNAQKPLLLMGLIFLVVQGVFIYYHIANNEAERLLRIRNLVQKIGNTAIEQHNRDIIEATFTVAVEELGARNILLCEKNKVQISFPYSQSKCRSQAGSWFDQEIEVDASGYSDYKFVFLMPRWKLSSTFVAIVLMTTLSLVFFFVIMFRVQRKLKSDILKPLEKYPFSEGKMEIAEMEKVRESIAKAQQSDRDAAILKAKRESEAKFIHNIQSPLGLIKILEERLGPQLDPDSARLFGNVVSQISDVTASYAKRSTSELGTVDENLLGGNALVDLLSTIEACVDTKGAEIIGRDSRPKITFDNLTGLTTAHVEASLVELRSILSNILNNAVDASATKIELRLRLMSNTAVLEIEDNGSGVDEAVQETLFDKDVTFGKAHGTGFGLYHAKKFLTRWGGSIDLEHTSSSGSFFAIRLPLHQLPAIKLREHHQIVILEDKKHERDRLKKKIRAAGCNLNPIVEFERTSHAIEWFEKTEVPISDIILFADNDLGETERSGFEMIRDLGIADLSYLVTNSHGSEELVASCKSIGLPIVPKACIPDLSITAI
ncbi:MAG: HAMP domain-containing histidine kinase [Bdellovibrionaceae bacterium]|nr:HAMP domain-containing histidine kinase [Pseudobdellovibrionaceae bacterium]